MNKLTASNIASFINQLDKKAAYNYLDPKNKGLIQIVEVELPEGPIKIKRWNPTKKQTPSSKKIEPISTEMIWRIANAFSPNQPINFDRVLAGSYNTRSVLESLLAHTSQFYYCYPGRIEDKGGTTKIKDGHKHLIWLPDNPHQQGISMKTETSVHISEIPSIDIYYDPVTLPDDILNPTIDVNIQKRHAQIQFLLYKIGYQLGYSTWIAQNDKGIKYQDKKFGEYEGIVSSLRNKNNLIGKFEEAISSALLIDCIWFKNGSLMPAVMEIEHSTGVNSGLLRMKKLYNHISNFKTRYVIVASDDDRDEVIRKANAKDFADLNTRFFSYSAVEELYALCQKRKLKGVTEEFLDCYMEPIL